ncbi:MAG: CDP-glycerol glycerophosphotransferase family protein [Lachnospiraceae bacterium]|nr:CDP-glycerol glycerophosphotransferase family protein [Lachnospiraceae bacterium]
MPSVKEKIRNSLPYRLYRNTAIFIVRLFPVKKNKVVFDNFGGKGFGDDPKYIALALLKNYPGEFKLYWFTKDMKTPLAEGIVPVKYGTIKAAYHMATAKVWVDNIKSSFKIKKKKNQFYIQTWHSTLGLKKNEAQVSNLPEKYVKEAKRDAAMTDLMYSNNDFRYEIYKNHFWYTGKVIKCSVPRNSVIMERNEELINNIKEKYGIRKEQALLLYAPTFRKEKNKENISFDYYKVCNAIGHKFGTECVCMVRLHPNDTTRYPDMVLPEGVVNVSDYPDMQELLAACDYLITDYSAVMFDFSFAKKPVFLLMKDYEEYLKKERELQFTMEELPFCRALTEEELLQVIENYSENKYQEKCNVFFERIGLNENGDGAKVIAGIIYESSKGLSGKLHSDFN